MEYFSLQLKSLYSAVDTINCAFQQQLLGDHIVGSLETLCHSINDIRSEMNQKINEIIALD